MSIFLVAAFALVLSITITAEPYYQCCNHRSGWNAADSSCQESGSYLASIHNKDNSDEALNQCIDFYEQEQKLYNLSTTDSVYNCYIGLYSDISNFTKSDWKWSDGTSYEFDLKWCFGYPIKFNLSLMKNVNESVVYIDINEGCYKNTYNLNEEKYFICGPEMVPSELESINMFYDGFILGSISLIYVAFIGCELIYNLYFKEYNWLIEPTKWIKCTAVTVPFLAFVSCLCYIIGCIIDYVGWKQTNITPPNVFFTDEWPVIFNISGAFFSAVVIAYLAISPIGFLHIHLQLKSKIDYFRDDEFVKMVFPSCIGCRKYFDYYMKTLIIFYAIVFILNFVVISFRSYSLLNIMIFVFIGIDLTLIHVLLLYFYAKTLHVAAKYHYFRNAHTFEMQNDFSKDNYNNPMIINDRMHELMIEVSRHFVVFGITILINLLMMICLGIVVNNSKNGQLRNAITVIVMVAKEILFIHSIYLSFAFNITKYEQQCKLCNSITKLICSRIVKTGSAKMLNESRAFQDYKIGSHKIQLL